MGGERFEVEGAEGHDGGCWGSTIWIVVLGCFCLSDMLRGTKYVCS